MDEDAKRIEVLTKLRRALPGLFGAVGTLFVIVLAGDLRDFCCELPAGWTALWLLTTLTSLSLGAFLLVGRWWRPIPRADRRRPAMGYLLAAFVNLLSFSVYVQIASDEPGIFCLPFAGGLALMLVYLLVYVRPDRAREETFP
jgi:hypothetical protein